MPRTTQGNIISQSEQLCTNSPMGSWPFLAFTFISWPSGLFAFNVFPSLCLLSTRPVSLFTLFIYNSKLLEDGYGYGIVISHRRFFCSLFSMFVFLYFYFIIFLFLCSWVVFSKSWTASEQKALGRWSSSSSAGISWEDLPSLHTHIHTHTQNTHSYRNKLLPEAVALFDSCLLKLFLEGMSLACRLLYFWTATLLLKSNDDWLT